MSDRAGPRRAGTRLIGFLLVGLAMAACDASPLVAGGPVPWTAQANGFVLQATMPKLDWLSTEAIGIDTTLTWTGDEPTKAIWTSGGGPVSFSLERADGTVTMPAASDLVCARQDYARGVPTQIPFSKSGGYSDSDPNAVFFEQYFADPLLHLPRGQWKLIVTADAMLAECAMNAPKLSIRLPDIVLFIH